MPPKKAAAAAKLATTAKVNGTKVNGTIVRGTKAAPTTTKPAATEPKPTATKRKASDFADEEPKTKRAKSTTPAPAPKKALATKPAPRKRAPGSQKVEVPKKSAKAVEEKSAEPEQPEDDGEIESEEEVAPAEEPKSKPATKAAAKKVADAKPTVKKAVAAKKVAPAKEESERELKEKAAPAAKAKEAIKKATPKKVATRKAGPVINTAPTQRLDVYVFGEGSAGELGLGAEKDSAGRKPVDVKRPRLNERLSAKLVGVVQLACGGMHCAALTFDNKVLTWGVNDQGALGRETGEGKMVEMKEKDDDDSDTESDEGGGLNPTEAEPRQVDPAHFPESTKFVQLVASDSATFALTDEGLVYGWGTFRGNDGILGFRNDGAKTQKTPILIPELKKIKTLVTGTNHVLAMNEKGKVFAWGAGEQNQLARRVVSRTATGALVPREFGLQRKVITRIGCGDYHCFAVDNKGQTYAWGLNTFGQTGIPKDEDDENATISKPTVVENLKGYEIEQIAGGGHHSLACTESGQVLVWGRVDSAQGGMEISDMPKESLFYDEHNKPRFLMKPVVLPDIQGEHIAAATDTCIVIDKQGKAYSWGFSANYQTGQGTTDDIEEATEIDNTAVRGKRLVWAGAGGQFGIVAGVAGDVEMVNGVH